MAERSSNAATGLLERATQGDRAAAAELLPLVYQELRALARSRMRSEARGGAGLTMQPTALVHEVYVRLVGAGDPGWNGKGHFFGAAARAMRRLLVEQARKRQRLKHGGEWGKVQLGEEPPAMTETRDWVGIDAALEALEKHDAALADVVHLRFFAGLTVEETASALGASVRSVERDWAFARAWLEGRMRREEGA